MLYYAALFIHVDLEAAKQSIGAAKIEDAPPFGEVLKSGWHFRDAADVSGGRQSIYPEIFQITIESAAVYSTAMLMVLGMIFGYRGNRV